jgi:hypothetical protein
MPIHVLAPELAVGLLLLTCFVLRVASLFADSSRLAASDELREEKQDAVVEAMIALGLADALALKTDLIVHNGLSASRRRL